MSRTNRTRYAILGMLSLGEKSGYDLKQDFERRMSPFWAESLGQIYPTLHRLRAEGLVAPRRDGGAGRRGRTVYRITRQGRTALRNWLAETPGREQVRNELLLKLFFGPEIGIEASLAHLEVYESLQRRLADSYRGLEAEIERQAVSEEAKVFWRLTLLCGQRVTDARARWCRDAQRMLREHRHSERRGRRGRTRKRRVGG